LTSHHEPDQCGTFGTFLNRKPALTRAADQWPQRSIFEFATISYHSVGPSTRLEVEHERPDIQLDSNRGNSSLPRGKRETIRAPVLTETRRHSQHRTAIHFSPKLAVRHQPPLPDVNKNVGSNGSQQKQDPIGGGGSPARLHPPERRPLSGDQPCATGALAAGPMERAGRNGPSAQLGSAAHIPSP